MYREPRPLAKVAPRASLLRLAWAWCRGVPRKLEARRARQIQLALQRRPFALDALRKVNPEIAEAIESFVARAPFLVAQIRQMPPITKPTPRPVNLPE
jgi:hypothetical protein